MSLQLIFVVETNKKCKSDWIYIKETIDCFYQYDQTRVKLNVVYMDGKGKYRKKEKEIKSLMDQYNSQSVNNHSKVIYCFDCDDYEKNPECISFLKEVKQYCQDNAYEFVWFCKDIEHVYLGKQVDDCQKQKEAAAFKRKKMIANMDVLKLNATQYSMQRSNIVQVLDTCPELNRKQRMKNT